MNAEEFRARLQQDIPGALIEATPQAQSNGHGETAAVPTRAKGEKAPVNLLLTNDAVVHTEHVPRVLLYARDQLGYELLSNITAVDYLANGVIELVYHLMSLEGGPALVVKTRTPRDHASVPSITPFWPGANLQEREAYDLYGVDFPGHPNLRRVYMWDEFEGFPMRKDFPKQGDKYFGDDEG